MNPGDRFVVEVIGKANIDVRGVIARIAGVHSVTEKKKVERDGIYLKKVRVWGIGSTIEKSLLRINIAFPAIITTLMLTTFFFFMRRQVKLTGYRYPIIGFAVLNYCLSLLSGVFLFVILRAQEYSIMATFGILGMIMVVSMTSGFALSRMFWEDKRDVGR